MKQIKDRIHRFFRSSAWKLVLGIYVVSIVIGLAVTVWYQATAEKALVAEVGDKQQVTLEFEQLSAEYAKLANEDQVVKNASLSAAIQAIEDAYSNGARLFEERADLAVTGTKTKEIDLALAKYLRYLSDLDYPEAVKQAEVARAAIDKLVVELTPVPAPAATVVQAPVNNAAPGSGYSRQKVGTSRGEFVVSLIVAPGARAIIETAGDSDCGDNCPTKSLAEHVGASGGFAGINGAYFCPPDYARCQGKVNTFDTLAVNGRSKAVLNRANNVYSVVPIVAAYGSSLSFYDQTVQWGVDTSSGGALANYPRLVRDGGVATTEENGKGTRGFIGMKDGAIVIGHVYAASFGDTAEVLKKLGLQNALNLDGGGSTALWYEGSYKAGPGRSLPTAIVLVR